MDDGLLNTYGVLKKQELLLHRNDSFVIIVLYYHKAIFCQCLLRGKFPVFVFFRHGSEAPQLRRGLPFDWKTPAHRPLPEPAKPHFRTLKTHKKLVLLF